MPAPFSPFPIAPSRGSARSGPLCCRHSPSVRVVLGAHRLEEPEASQQIFGVDESIAHLYYDPYSGDNDIRLLKVSPARVAGRRGPAHRGLGGSRRPGGEVARAPWGAGGRWGAPRPARRRRERPTRARADTRCQCFSGEAGPRRGVRWRWPGAHRPRLGRQPPPLPGSQSLERAGTGAGGSAPEEGRAGWGRACGGVQGGSGSPGRSSWGALPQQRSHLRPWLPAQLNRPATLNEYVKLAHLPSPHVDLNPGTVCYVAGWGDISSSGSQPTELMETSTTIAKRSLCRTLWRGRVSTNMLCAASRNTTLQGVCSVSALPAPCPPAIPLQEIR